MTQDEGQASLLGSPAIDQAACGIGAGIASTLCMHPLDLLKVKLQVANRSQNVSSVGKEIVAGLRAIVRRDGWTGLYRGLGVNVVGNAASWGAYFLWYTQIKARKTGNDPTVRLSAPQHLAASVEAGIYSAIVTNPLWVIKTRMFTSRRGSEGAYRGVVDGLLRIGREEGIRGLWKGTTLALIGISNGAVQFMAYEHLKRWGKDRKRRLRGDTGQVGEIDLEQLSDGEYILMSGSAKLLAIGLTYPYQVVRSRMQNEFALSKAQVDALPVGSLRPYRSIPDCVVRTYRAEGLRAFYNGLAPSALRVLPGTCVTFVVYERLSNFLSTRARQLRENSAHQVAP